MYLNRFQFIFSLILLVFTNQGFCVNPVRNQNLAGESELSIEASVYPMKKELWLQQFKKNFSKDFCSQAQWLQICYHTNPESCKSLISEKLEACVPPKKGIFPIQSLSAARSMGEKMGQCLGTHFEERYPLNKKEADLCYLDIF